MDKINVPAWNHFPFLGYLHYQTRITNKFINQPNKLLLPRLNPYIGFINHACPFVYKKDVGTQTDPDKAMELGQQIIDQNGLSVL